MSVKIIVALDYPEKTKALSLLEHLDPEKFAVKIGFEMFILYGPAFVKEIIHKRFKVFLDLKFYDIPQTVANACKAQQNLGVWMLNVHAQGGLKMLESAKNALNNYGKDRPILIAVTILTSMNEQDLFVSQEEFHKRIQSLCDNVQKSHLDGVVCSALDVPLIKKTFGKNFITVTPGIRAQNDAQDDQKRIVTPEDALKLGSDYLVIGRSITQTLKPEKVIKELKGLLRAYETKNF